MRADLAPGTILAGRFRIEEAIGSGGYGVVYRATQLDGDRQVALKVLHPDLVRTDEGRRRFEREAELARRLRHPNTVYLYDFGSDDQGNGFIVYELLRGRPLSAMLEGTTGLTAERVARIAAQVLRALGEAHGLGIVHRDVKPSNIFLADYAGERDYVKLLDFGIAKDLSTTESTRLTQTGQTLGTPHYMAPEQITAKPSTPATDLYAVGLVMAEMITGSVVYQGTAIQVLAQQLSHEPTPLSRQVQEHRFGQLIQRATLKDASQRYASANEMLEHLERIERATHHAPTPAPPPTAVPHMPPPQAPPAWPTPPMAPQLVAAPFAPKPASSGAMIAVVAVTLVLFLVGGVGFAFWAFVRTAPAPPPRAQTEVPATAPAVPTAVPVTSASSGPSEGDERRRAWLTTSLKGHDNAVASLRKATITESDAGAFRVTINNQFGFTCDLTFSEEGRPQELRKCASREGWGAHNPPDNVIKLTCTETEKEEVCKGSYFLSNQGFSSKEEMQLIRPKGNAAEPASSPPPSPTTKPQLPGPPPLPPAPTTVFDRR